MARPRRSLYFFSIKESQPRYALAGVVPPVAATIQVYLPLIYPKQLGAYVIGFFERELCTNSVSAAYRPYGGRTEAAVAMIGDDVST